ncbi:unnamed protein product [Sphagnum tenellum]
MRHEKHSLPSESDDLMDLQLPELDLELFDDKFFAELWADQPASQPANEDRIQVINEVRSNEAVVEEIKVPDEVTAPPPPQAAPQAVPQAPDEVTDEDFKMSLQDEDPIMEVEVQAVVEEIKVPDEVTAPPPPQAAPQAVPQALAVVEEIQAPDAPPCPTCGETCGETVTLDHRTHMFSHHKQEMALMTLVGSKTISCTLCDFNLPTANRRSAGNVARHVALYHDEITNCANQEEREWLKSMARWRKAPSSLKRKATPATTAAAKRSKVIHRCDKCDHVFGKPSHLLAHQNAKRKCDAGKK